VLVAVRQGQRRDAAATGEERLGKCAARKSKYVWLYLYSGKLELELGLIRIGNSAYAQRGKVNISGFICTVARKSSRRHTFDEYLPMAVAMRQVKI
jgi:hypothetical protein